MRSMIVVALIALAACASSSAQSPPAASALIGEEAAEARAVIWPLEEAIYRGRAAGDVNTYYSMTAKGYLGWPPVTDAPIRAQSVRPAQAPSASLEKIELTFVDLTVQGEVAIIYYSTHRTQTADGKPADDRFDVTHTWVRQSGQWKLLGGMARRKPVR